MRSVSGIDPNGLTASPLITAITKNDLSRAYPGAWRGRHLAVTLTVALVAGLSACGQDTPHRHSPGQPEQDEADAKALPIAAKIDFSAVTRDNTSNATMTIDSIPIQGPGIGTMELCVVAQFRGGQALGPQSARHAGTSRVAAG